MSRIEEVFESNPGLTIRKFAEISGVTYHKLLTASKKPVEGQIYDPTAWNWDEMQKHITDEHQAIIDATDWSSIETTKKAKVEQDTSIFKPNTKWHLRRHGWATIVYRNDSYIVFLLEDSEQPKSWAIDTWLINGPSKEERK